MQILQQLSLHIRKLRQKSNVWLKNVEQVRIALLSYNVTLVWLIEPKCCLWWSKLQHSTYSYPLSLNEMSLSCRY